MTDNTEKRGGDTQAPTPDSGSDDAREATTAPEATAAPEGIAAPQEAATPAGTAAPAETAPAPEGTLTPATAPEGAPTPTAAPEEAAAPGGTAGAPPVALPASTTAAPTGPAPSAAMPAAAPWPTGHLSPANEVTWSVVAHLSWLVGSLVGLPPLGPLIAYLVLRERGTFVRHQSAQALNFHLSLLIYSLAVAVLGTILTLVTFGVAAPILIAAVAAIGLLTIVLSIVAAASAGKGQWYRYPLTLPLVH